ncbi:hypothetical protein DSO57_1002649 [Entomophthora muscae]|uniref:Uncharacterized protein n=1 Tax=Entomophthora muscae TaxID=34485 RepID=A0ACC2TJZ9_9FUNG|nr:hypothetical protein DSO57_1002649 [Entomophthora muscae]
MKSFLTLALVSLAASANLASTNAGDANAPAAPTNVEAPTVPEVSTANTKEEDVKVEDASVAVTNTAEAKVAGEATEINNPSSPLELLMPHCSETTKLITFDYGPIEDLQKCEGQKCLWDDDVIQKCKAASKNAPIYAGIKMARNSKPKNLHILFPTTPDAGKAAYDGVHVDATEVDGFLLIFKIRGITQKKIALTITEKQWYLWSVREEIDDLTSLTHLYFRCNDSETFGKELKANRPKLPVTVLVSSREEADKVRAKLPWVASFSLIPQVPATAATS